jgi:hypothetical protein
MFRMLVLGGIGAALALAPPAFATDSHAPKGARPDWLPNSEWVMSSWLPYDETRLEALLQTNRTELSHWLDDRRSLAALARRRGWPSAKALTLELLRPRAASVTPALLQRLQRRTLATLTQPHLARHVFFHIFHTPAIADDAPALLDMTPTQFRALRASGASPLRMASLAGRSPDVMTGELDALLVVRARRAIATGSSTADQAGRLLQLQREALPEFLAHTYRTPREQFTFACSLHVF